MIYVDSKFTSSRTPTPKLLSIKPGIHRLALTKPGYKMYEDRITIEPGKVLELDVLLTKTDSEGLSRLAREQYIEVYLTVESTPSGADVYLDDEHIGRTPVRGHAIQLGEPKDRELRIAKTGYTPHEETVGWIAIRDRIKIQISTDLKPVTEPKQVKQANTKPEAKSKPEPKISPLSQERERFAINNQVIAFSILLLVIVAILVVRVVIRLRQRSGSD
jgi:hypothetical protein